MDEDKPEDFTVCTALDCHVAPSPHGPGIRLWLLEKTGDPERPTLTKRTIEVRLSNEQASYILTWLPRAVAASASLMAPASDEAH